MPLNLARRFWIVNRNNSVLATGGWESGHPKLHEKEYYNYLLIIYFIKCSLIFQDSYMRSGDRPPFSFSYSGHLDYVHNVPTV